MAAGADIVIVEHVAEAAIDEGRPRCRRLEPEAVHGTFRTAAERLDILGNDTALGLEPTRSDRDAQRVEHDLFDQLDELLRQRIKRERGRVLRNQAGDAVAIIASHPALPARSRSHKSVRIASATGKPLSRCFRSFAGPPRRWQRDAGSGSSIYLRPIAQPNSEQPFGRSSRPPATGTPLEWFRIPAIRPSALR